jgi:DNA-binding ferritin-like protein
MGKFKEMDLLRQEREQALDKMAENARELGLNYDTPLSAFVRSSDEDKAEVMERVIDKAIEAQKELIQTQIVKDNLQPAPWVGLTDDERKDIINNSMTPSCVVITTEAKLKEKNCG